MTAYAIAHLRQPGKADPRVWSYLERIQATLDPFEGRFLVHGAEPHVVRGRLAGPVPATARTAREWR
ncbi:hypothetical protein [Amycolatopsis sp. NBC_00345]|uniref:hypothetical protein n=1 Tax=Amycolatopsis sp. NBC_00345 TaxID=2975955 RepID=UPI003FA45328